MEKTKKEKTFSEEYDRRSRARLINDCSWFGIVWGIVLLLAAAYHAICTEGVVNIICKAIAVLGILLLVAGVAAPLILQKVTHAIRAVFSAFGGVVLKIFLLPVYFVMTVINAFTRKKFSAKFGFGDFEKSKLADTAYCDFNADGRKTSKHTVIDVLGLFVSNGMYFLVPVILVLLFVGAVMFFASSSSVFSFVYTMF
ncbi:MAG: hypothetical protein J6A60_03485 [Clostridia bacterium]|nr:hypothetical protein [Clostridia bacterium]